MGKFALPCHVSKDIILSNLLNPDVSSLILNYVKKQETIDEIKFRTDITDTFKDTYGPDWTRILSHFHHSPLFKKLHPEMVLRVCARRIDEYIAGYANLYNHYNIIIHTPLYGNGIQQIYLNPPPLIGGGHGFGFGAVAAEAIIPPINGGSIPQPINNNAQINLTDKKMKKNKAKQEKPIRKERTKQMRHENRAMMKRMRKGSFKH